jgi:TRAP-type C4-dicarboxylate transport system permease small subunit
MLKSARGRWRAFVSGVITVTSLALLGVLIWWGIDLVWRIRFQTWASLDFLSMGWAYAAIPVGAAVSVVGLLAHQFDPVDEQLDTAQ